MQGISSGNRIAVRLGIIRKDEQICLFGAYIALDNEKECEYYMAYK